MAERERDRKKETEKGEKTRRENVSPRSGREIKHASLWPHHSN